jgi:O-antigen/teichoic acid export membrane protein
MKKILKIYLWQIISILFNFASIFVVTPYLSSNHELYGIYTLVIAAYIFLAYADFGFLSAGMKFAAESYAQKDLKQEIKIIGFTGFIFLIFVIIYGVIMFCISFHPEILIKSLSNKGEINIAKNLLLILSLSSPVFVLQRLLQIVFAVRLEDYVFQRILIVSNILKISFAFILFRSGGYPIVTYFLFSQICMFTACITGLIFAKKSLGYDIGLLLKSFRFSYELYNKTKGLAFVSIFLTICWILYYELDPFVISKLLGAKFVAIYAIGFTLMEYFRSIFGIIFSPFIAKFNHYMGLKDFEGLKLLFIKMLTLSLPIVAFPVLAISITIKHFIYTWVGPQYQASVHIAQFLVLSYVLSFISSPTGILIMAYQRIRILYFTSSLLPVIYWAGIFFTFSFWGLQAFAHFKFISLTLAAIVYIFVFSQIFKLNPFKFLYQLLVPAILPVAFLISVSIIVEPYYPIEKNKLNLLMYLFYNGIIISTSILIYYFCSSIFRQNVKLLLGSFFKKSHSFITK